MTKLAILIKSADFLDLTTMAMVASGCVAADIEVVIFAMGDAVGAFRKDTLGKDMKMDTHFTEVADKVMAGIDSGKVNPWWELLADLKEFGEISVHVCSMIVDALELQKEDFADIVDGIAGVAYFAGAIEDADQVMTI